MTGNITHAVVKPAPSHWVGEVVVPGAKAPGTAGLPAQRLTNGGGGDPCQPAQAE
jgi:hypothetical protein